MCVAKHQPHVLYGYGKILQAFPDSYRDCELYRVVHMCEIYIEPRFFIRSLLIFKGAHEIASLCCYFLIMQKVKGINI